MNSGDEARAPRSGLLLMAIILFAMALLAVYSNVQKAHVKQIETVTLKSPPFPGETPASTAVPKEP